METKDILIWLFVFIVGSLIVSFLIYPSNFESFKNNVKELAPSIPPIKDNLIISSSCQESAKELIPEHIYFKKYLDYAEKREMGPLGDLGQIPENKWVDGETLNMEELVKGVETGENIKLYYYKEKYLDKDYNWKLRTGTISYREKVISNEGLVEGYNYFNITNMVFEKIENPFIFSEIIEGEQIVNENNMVYEVHSVYTATWENLDNAKEIFNLDEIPITLIARTGQVMNNEQVVCEDKMIEDTGEMSCGIINSLTVYLPKREDNSHLPDIGRDIDRKSVV